MMRQNIQGYLHLASCNVRCVNHCNLLSSAGRYLSGNTNFQSQTTQMPYSTVTLQKLCRGCCKNNFLLQWSKKTSIKHHLWILHGKSLSTCSAFTSVSDKSLLSRTAIHMFGWMPVTRTSRMKHSRSGNGERPLVFVPRDPVFGKKSPKKQAAEPKAPTTARSRTKKPTRLGMQDMKDSWLCTAFSTAEEYHLEHLSLDLQAQGSFMPIAMPQDAQDVLLMEVISSESESKSEPSEIFFFREGSVVFWNVPDGTLKKVLRIVSKHEFRPYEVALVTWENEHINFSYGSQGTRLTDEAIILDQNTDAQTMALEKFAFSNAMALSVKLGIWESSVDKFTSSLESIPESLKRGHRLKMSRVEVMQKTGELFSLRHQINLSSDLLISPDFYWDRDDLDELYNKTCQFYSIGRRTRVINEKLNHCSELVELMRTHLSERHSLKLEWMIIILIGVEVIFEVIHYIQRYYEDSDKALPEEEASSNRRVASHGHR